MHCPELPAWVSSPQPWRLAEDLTWNYSNILKAMNARKAAADMLKKTVTMVV